MACCRGAGADHPRREREFSLLWAISVLISPRLDLHHSEPEW